MLEQLLKLYTMYMLFDVRSPMPHLEGPPGCGKSSVLEDMAVRLGVNIHIINVSRLSPLEVEGIQMPHTSGEDMVLKMLPATFWTQLKEGDILALDEFLRGFPEVYNALLDILTSRKAGPFRLPKVFIVGASNSATAYDPALEDRLHHLPVPDPRASREESRRLSSILVDATGMHPAMVDSPEMAQLMRVVVHPMFAVLDSFKGGVSTGVAIKGKSIRNLIGQVKLRDVQTSELQQLLDANTRHCIAGTKWQYLVLASGVNPPPSYLKARDQLLQPAVISKMSDVQKLNLLANFSLIDAEKAKITITTPQRQEVEDDEFFEQVL